MLTKEQDKIATRLRDAGVPGDIAVLLASRALSKPIYPWQYIPDSVDYLFWWHEQPEGEDWWATFCESFEAECHAKGIK